MDTTSVLVTVGGLALVGVVLWYFFGAKDEDDDDSSAVLDGPTEYACPMHPWIVSLDPEAVCSVCGMHLVWRD